MKEIRVLIIYNYHLITHLISKIIDPCITPYFHQITFHIFFILFIRYKVFSILSSINLLRTHHLFLIYIYIYKEDQKFNLILNFDSFKFMPRFCKSKPLAINRLFILFEFDSYKHLSFMIFSFINLILIY